MALASASVRPWTSTMREHPIESEAALLADAVGRRVEDLVLERTRVDRVLGELLGARRPVGREYDEVGSGERGRPRGLGEAAVVADVDADATTVDVPELIHPIARRHEVVEAEVGSMGLPVRAPQARPVDENRRIVDGVAVSLQPALPPR